MFAAQLAEDVFTRCVLPCLCFLGLLRNLENFEEDVAHLLGGGDVERGAREVLDLLVEARDITQQHLTEFAQRFAVQAYAFTFHGAQHRDQRHFDVVEQFPGGGSDKLRREAMVELQRDVGILGGVFFDFLKGHIAHGALVLAFFADQCFDGDRCVVQVGFRQYIHVVTHLRLQQVMGHHRIKQRLLQVNTVAGQYIEVVFHVLSDLHDGSMLVNGPEQFNQRLCLISFGGDGNIPTLVRGATER